MERMERVSASLLPEFELTASLQEAARKAWAVLDFMYIGMPKEDTLAAFGVTYEEVIPFIQKWERMRNHQLVA